MRIRIRNLCAPTSASSFLMFILWLRMFGMQNKTIEWFTTFQVFQVCCIRFITWDTVWLLTIKTGNTFCFYSILQSCPFSAASKYKKVLYHCKTHLYLLNVRIMDQMHGKRHVVLSLMHLNSYLTNISFAQYLTEWHLWFPRGKINVTH